MKEEKSAVVEVIWLIAIYLVVLWLVRFAIHVGVAIYRAMKSERRKSRKPANLRVVDL